MPDREPASLEFVQRSFVHAGLGVDDVGSGVEAWTFHGSFRRQTFVEDSADDSQERSPESRSSGRPRRERQTVDVERQQRRHHALHPRSRLEPAAQQVGFAQHAVEVKVEARNEVP
jgi:hypothetical protein